MLMMVISTAKIHRKHSIIKADRSLVAVVVVVVVVVKVVLWVWGPFVVVVVFVKEKTERVRIKGKTPSFVHKSKKERFPFFLETKQKTYGESRREEENLRERESKRERERKSLWGMKEVCEVFFRCNGLAYKKGLERRPNGLKF